MSLSKEERLDNIRLALNLLLEALGNQYYRTPLFNREADVFDKMFSTAWQELIDKCYLRSTANGYFLELTASGWRECLRLSGKLQDDTFKRYLGRISQVLKDRVKGRHHAQFVRPEEVATEVGIPLGLVLNVIDSDLLMYEFNRVTAKWASHEGGAIEVPTNFGLELI